MKTIFTILLLVGFGVSSAGEHPARTTFSKADPNLVPVQCPVEDDYESALCWNGELAVSGRLVIEFDRAPPGDREDDKDGQASFEPDSLSQSKLLAATNYYPLPVKVTWLRNRPREILAPLIGEVATQSIMTGTFGRYEFMVNMTLTKFTTSIDCDHRGYGVGYSMIRLQNAEPIAMLQPQNLGC